MVYVDKVHYATDTSGNKLYIAKMKWTNTLSEDAYEECGKDAMIRFIKENPGCARTKYRRYGYWYDGEEIHVVDDRYLRTDKNYIKADNLENLPEY